MQIPSGTGDNKEAFLVRKATDHKVTTGRGRELKSGKWFLREQSKDMSGGSTTSTVGMSEGVGVDARKWVEGLLRFV